MKKEQGLLEMLKERAGCMYLSDLHQKRFQSVIGETLAEYDPGLYSMDEWKDAVSYITNEDREFGTVEEAKSFLNQYFVSSGRYF